MKFSSPTQVQSVWHDLAHRNLLPRSITILTTCARSLSAYQSNAVSKRIEADVLQMMKAVNDAGTDITKIEPNGMDVALL
jgi:hypothetical protein